MPWAVAGSLLILWALGLLSAYMVKGIAPTLLIGALSVVLLRSLQARWATRGVPEALGADEHTP
jgi:hypothetical protein